MIRINLLPYRSERRRELIIQQIVLAAVPLAVALVTVGIFHLTMNSRIEGLQTRIHDVKEDIKKSKVALKEIEAYKSKKSTLLKKMDVIKSLRKGKDGPVHMLDELASRLPGHLWLTDFSQSGSSLEINGMALDNIAISNYMVALENSPYFSKVDLKKIQTKAIRGRNGDQLREFTITFTVSYEPDNTAKPKQKQS